MEVIYVMMLTKMEPNRWEFRINASSFIIYKSNDKYGWIPAKDENLISSVDNPPGQYEKIWDVIKDLQSDYFIRDAQ